MEDQNSLYELTTSRNGLTVPVINGIHLHSIYNPSKEAEAFARGHQDSIEKKSNILILGLGFGYHVEEIAKIASRSHSDYRIIVIEPNQQLVEDFNSKRSFEDSKISILCEPGTQNLYETESFVHFLIHRPCIIKHDASFNLEKDYFRKFLTHSASNQISDYLHLVESQDYTNYLETYRDDTFEHLVDSIISHGRVNNKKDFAMLALMTMFNDMKTQSEVRG